MVESRERGQSLVEYALIFTFVIILVVVMLLVLGPATRDMFSNIVGAFATAAAN